MQPGRQNHAMDRLKKGAPRPLDGLCDRRTWVFDLDNTLYPAECDLFAQVSVRMRQFIAQRFGLDDDAARALQKQYFHEYGTTLRGLMTRHGLNPTEFLDFVHAIDVTAVSPSPALERALGQLSGRKVIFTNASVAHAERVMARLGVDHHFDGIFDICAAEYRPKPTPEIYTAMLARFDADATQAVMVEDIARNLKPAHDLGMATVWVRTDTAFGLDGADGEHVHHVADNLVAWLEAVLSAGRPQTTA